MTNIKKIKQKDAEKKNKVKKSNNNNNNNNNKSKKNKNKKNENKKTSLKVILSNKNNSNIKNNNSDNNKKKEIEKKVVIVEKKANNNKKKVVKETPIENKEISNEEDDEKYNLWNPKPVVSKSTTAVAGKSSSLQNEMSEKLKGSRFRWLNETLYTSHSKDAFKEFSEDRSLFDQYHDGFKSQVEGWPINPLDLIIQDLANIKQKKKIADLGCGEAKLAERLQHQHTIQSFDLVAVNERVIACDVSKLPLTNESIDIAVFCLSLMGTNFIDFIVEAERILIKGGLLKIAEIESRITDINIFINEIESHGFKLVKKNTNNQYFTLFEFSKLLKKDQQFTKNQKQLKKLKQQNKDKDTEDEPILKPCLYKKR